MISSGGVEDTRLEAKAKDKKKNPRPRPRTAFPKTDTLEAKDRNARGQGQGHQRKYSPKKKVFTKIFQAISKKKKKKKRSSQKFFKRSPQKNVFQKIFQALHKLSTIQKIVLSLSRGLANFRGLEASRPRTSKCVLEARTSSRTPPLMIRLSAVARFFCSLFIQQELILLIKIESTCDSMLLNNYFFIKTGVLGAAKSSKRRKLATFQ